MFRFFPLFLLLSLLLLRNCEGRNITQLAGIWKPSKNSSLETLGSLSLVFYGHENLWELLAGANRFEKPFLKIESEHLTKDTPITTPLYIPPATHCPQYMNSSCLQILNYLEDQNNRWKDNETIYQILQTKLKREEQIPFIWDTTMKDDDGSLVLKIPSSDHSRNLQILEGIELILIAWDIFSIFKEILELKPVLDWSSATLAINIINETPQTLMNFEFIPVNGDQATSTYWLPFLIESGETGQVITSVPPAPHTGQRRLSMGGIKFRIASDLQKTWLITWVPLTGSYNHAQFPGSGYVASYWTVFKIGYISDTENTYFDINYCNSPQGWITTRLNYQYSVQVFAGGSDTRVDATVILYEDWGEGDHDPRGISATSFYRIGNQANTSLLTMSADYTNPLSPIYQIYQYSQNANSRYKEWRIELIDLTASKEEGFAIINIQTGRLLSATETNTLTLERYDQDNIRSQLWLFFRQPTDRKYYIQNMKYRTFLSSQNASKDFDSWTLIPDMYGKTLNERFTLDWVRLDTGPSSVSIEDNLYYTIASESTADMLFTAREDAKLYLRPPLDKNKRQLWLVKNVILPQINISGYIIMNHDLNLLVTMTDDKKLGVFPMFNATNSSQALSQLWDIQLGTSSIYTKTRYKIRNIKYNTFYLNIDEISNNPQLSLSEDPNNPGFILVESTAKSEYPFESGSSYHISTALTIRPYTVDTFDQSRIYGWAITGQDKQKWEIRAPQPSEAGVYYLMTLYKYPGDTSDYYLTNENGTPKSSVGEVSKQNVQKWKFVPDQDYYNLFYKIISYSNSNAYLTAPESKTNDGSFTLEANKIDSRSQDQRFRIMKANNLESLQDNFYYMLAPEIAPEMKVKAKLTGNDTTIELNSTTPINNMQYWLLKRATSNGKTGYIIMNHGLNLLITLSNNMSINPAPMLKATSSEALSQLWDIQLLEENVCTIRSLQNESYYLNLNATSLGSHLISSTSLLPFILTNSQKNGETPLQNGVSYHISTALTAKPYVTDTYADSRIYGWQTTGYDKQKWQIRVPEPSEAGVYYLMTLYKYPGDTGDYYLTNENGTPKSSVGEVSKQNVQKWKFVPDQDYYNLFYKIISYSNSNAYLTAPQNKTNGGSFTLEANKIDSRSQDQRFRMMTTDDFENIKDGYLYLLAPEGVSGMQITAKLTSNDITIELNSVTSAKNMQYWLLKRATSNGKTGYIIMNHGLNLLITLSNNMSINPAPMLKATSSEALSQLWNIQLLGENVCTIRSLQNENYYLNLNATSLGSHLISSHLPLPFTLTNSQTKGDAPITPGVSYYISTALAAKPYVVDTFNNGRIYGWSISDPGQNKQKWEIRAPQPSEAGVYYLMTLYKYPGDTSDYYLTNENGTPKSSVGEVSKQNVQKWKFVPDQDYYNLFYKIISYSNSNAYLTAPESKTNDGSFTLEANKIDSRSQDQRFRLYKSYFII